MIQIRFLYVWRCSPKRTLTTEDIESLPGFKISKDLLIVICYSNTLVGYVVGETFMS